MLSPTSCSKKLVTVPLVLSRAARSTDRFATGTIEPQLRTEKDLASSLDSSQWHFPQRGLDPGLLDAEARTPGPGAGQEVQPSWLFRTPVARTNGRCDNRQVPVEGHLYGERVWFYDARGQVRRMGVSTHPADSTVVISLWQGDICTGTFRMPAKDAARLISTLAYGMTEAIPGQRPDSDIGPSRPPALVKIPSSCVRPITGNDRNSSSAAQVDPRRSGSAHPRKGQLPSQWKSAPVHRDGV